MRIVICGSMSFAKKMLKTKRLLDEMGHKCILPVDTIESVGNPSRRLDVGLLIEKDIIRDHLKKIQENDAILVLNYRKKGISGYIGGSVLIEIGFAHYLNKKIYLLYNIPRMSYRVEIEAMQPIILEGELGKLAEYA